MKYIVFDDCGTDVFTKEFDNKEQAMKEAQNEWDMLTSTDLKRRKGFYVLESANPDEEAENHFDGDIIFDFMAARYLKKLDDYTTETYDAGYGFLVDVVTHDGIKEAYLYHKDYGIKSMMFGGKAFDPDFIYNASLNLPTYEKSYQEEYMD